MLKMSLQLTNILSSTSVNNSKVIGSNSKNNRKLAKFNFIKAMYGVEKPSFLTFNAR